MSRKQGRLRIAAVGVFCLYAAGLLYFLFFAERYGRGAESYAYNLVPFHEILRFLRYRRLLGTRTVVLNLAGNVLGFVPFGLLLPVLFPSARKLGRTFFLGLEVSTLVELAQLLFCVGSFDVDDMILNTTGALLGYLLFAGGARLLRRRTLSEQTGSCFT